MRDCTILIGSKDHSGPSDAGGRGHTEPTHFNAVGVHNCKGKLSAWTAINPHRSPIGEHDVGQGRIAGERRPQSDRLTPPPPNRLGPTPRVVVVRPKQEVEAIVEKLQPRIDPPRLDGE